MIPTAIGLETGAGRTEAHNGLQDWFAEHGLQPYLPQLAERWDYNIATQFKNGGLDWTPETIAAVYQFKHPLVFHFNNYYYSTKPSALRWDGISQDALSAQEMTGYLKATRLWLAENGIEHPWMMVDEPPIPDGREKRWTQAIEDRVIKFVTAAVSVGWTVGVTVPGPAQFEYWYRRLPATRWILAAKHSRAEYEDRLGQWILSEIWLYNKRDTMIGLAQQMRTMDASGYLHWDATWKELALARILGDGSKRTDYEILPAMYDLLAELESFVTVTLASLDARVMVLEARQRAG